MASAAQITANRLNAEHSTGPVTVEGKARVAKNALRHGLTARHLVVRPEDQADFDLLQQSLLEELAPQGALETVTFHDLLHAAWNLQRFRAIEAELSAADDFSGPNPGLDRLTRYQSRSQRAYYRALKELRTLQTNRALRAEKLEHPADTASVPAITDINELTKLTRSEVADLALKEALNMLDFQAKSFVNNSRSRRRADVPAMDDRALRL